MRFIAHIKGTYKAKGKRTKIKWTNSKIIHLTLIKSITILNINGLNTPIKRKRLSNFIKKQQSCLKYHFKYNGKMTKINSINTNQKKDRTGICYRPNWKKPKYPSQVNRQITWLWYIQYSGIQLWKRQYYWLM